MGRSDMRKKFAAILALLMLGALTNGCFIDFERFKDATIDNESDVSGTSNGTSDTSDDTATSQDSDLDNDTQTDVAEDTSEGEDSSLDTTTEDTAPDTTDVADTDNSDVPEDVTEDTTTEDTSIVMDLPEDMVIPPTGPVGAPCDNDDACAEGQSCRLDFDDGLCSVACTANADCPEGSLCAAPAGTPWCVPICPGDTCPREGYNCLSWLGGSALPLCVSDADADRTLNALDNCPDQSNPDQSDLDGDGDGDRCDGQPRCPGQQTIDLAQPPAPLRHGAVVPVAPLNAVFVLGGTDETTQPTDRVMRYLRTTDTWIQDSEPLPYPVQGLDAVFDTRRGQLVATPGDGRGRLLVRTLTGPGGAGVVENTQWRQGVALPAPLWSAQIALMHPDTLVITGYTAAPTGDAPFSWVAYRIDLETENALTLAGEQLPGADNAGVLHLLAMDDGMFYAFNSEQRGRFYVIDPVADTFSSAQLLQIELFFELVPQRDQYPLAIWGSRIPFIYASRLDLGEAQKIDLDASSAQSSPYMVRVPDDITVETSSYDSTYRYDAHSLITLITAEEPGAQTLAQEHFLLCDDGLGEFDKDDDGITNLEDNCPSLRNISQLDIDGDGAGNPCDDDADGDGILNEDDQRNDDGQIVDLQFDTDNDGRDNRDDRDDDGDRIEDDLDPLPLDSDNDGNPNANDNDDDGDGFSDSEERAAGSNPTDNLSVPGGERLTFVRLSPGGRELIATTVSELGDGAVPMAIDVGTALPAWPRLEPNGERTVFTDIAVAEQPAIVVQGQGPAIRIAVEGLVASSVDFAPDATSLLFQRAAPERQDLWHIEQIAQDQWIVPMPMTTVLAMRTAMGTGLDVADDAMTIAFTEQTPGCAICKDAFTQPLNSDMATLVADTGLAERSVRISDDGQWLLIVSDRPEGGQLMMQQLGMARAAEPVIESHWNVHSADFAPDFRRLIVSMKRVETPEEPYRLYVVQPEERWIRALTDGTTSAVEISVAR